MKRNNLGSLHTSWGHNRKAEQQPRRVGMDGWAVRQWQCRDYGGCTILKAGIKIFLVRRSLPAAESGLKRGNPAAWLNMSCLRFMEKNTTLLRDPEASTVCWTAVRRDALAELVDEKCSSRNVKCMKMARDQILPFKECLSYN